MNLWISRHSVFSFLFVISSVSYLGKGAQDFSFVFHSPSFLHKVFAFVFAISPFPVLSRNLKQLLNGNLSSLSPIALFLSFLHSLFSLLSGLTLPYLTFSACPQELLEHGPLRYPLHRFPSFWHPSRFGLFSIFFPFLLINSPIIITLLTRHYSIHPYHLPIPLSYSLNRRPWFVFVNDPAIFFFPSVILYANQR